MRFADRNNPDLQAVAKDKILHIELMIVSSHVIRATDVLPDMGTISQDNAFQLNLEPDTRTETDRLFQTLAENGDIRTPMAAMLRGGYFGVLIDQLGIGWMFNCVGEDESLAKQHDPVGNVRIIGY